MRAAFFRVNRPTVVSETVDDEVVMIHLETGNYYSLRGTGVAVWDALERGTSLGSVTAAFVDAYEGIDVRGLIDAFVAELCAEELLVPAAGDPDGQTIEISLSRDAFEPPVLEKYTDMQHLILLDPVHEVDEAEGWPHPRDAG